ncbi:odorant receptor 4-like [Onthophagus taurus]|uniref:odorant receptor 4-like n=1 Tax=Onthophagus taurus TaxID=166361 RepID=UPI0039BE45EE
MIKHIYLNHTEMPFIPFSWFDTSSSPYYEIVWLYQSCWRMSFALLVCSCDALIIGILSHISNQFKMLQNAAKCMIQNAYEEAKNKKNIKKEFEINEIPLNILEKHLEEIIYYHNSIIELANQFEELFSLLLLGLFLATLFILCFIMYHASLFDLLSMRSTQDLTYVSVITLQIFLYCFWGNEVRIESELVSDAFWEMNFTGTDVRFQKKLIFILRRSQKPIVITAGKFTDLSLKTYAWV